MISHFTVSIAWKVLGPLHIQLNNNYFRGIRRLAVSITSEPISIYSKHCLESVRPFGYKVKK
jgi:hypothetical protein